MKSEHISVGITATLDIIVYLHSADLATQVSLSDLLDEMRDSDISPHALADISEMLRQASYQFDARVDSLRGESLHA